MVVDMASKLRRSVEPWASANENATNEPFRTVITGRSTGVRRDVIVTVRTIGGHSDLDADLSARSGSDGHNTRTKNRC